LPKTKGYGITGKKHIILLGQSAIGTIAGADPNGHGKLFIDGVDTHEVIRSSN